MSESWPPKVTPAEARIRWACSSVVVSVGLGIVVIVLNLVGPTAAILTALGLLIGWPIFAVLVTFGPTWRRHRRAMQWTEQAGLPLETSSQLADGESRIGLTLNHTELRYAGPEGLRATLNIAEITSIRLMLEPEDANTPDQLYGLWLTRRGQGPLQIRLDNPITAETWFWHLMSARRELGLAPWPQDQDRVDWVGKAPLTDEQVERLLLERWTPLGMSDLSEGTSLPSSAQSDWRMGAFSREFAEWLVILIPGTWIEPSQNPDRLFVHQDLPRKRK